jgi:hypothetical protein
MLVNRSGAATINELPHALFHRLAVGKGLYWTSDKLINPKW